MALIECYECKQSISSTAPACIHCGAPAAEAQATSSRPASISFGQLPRDETVAKVTPAAFGRRRKPVVESVIEDATATTGRPTEGWLKIAVFCLPPFFVWFLLRPGYSGKQRAIGFGWLALLILASLVSPNS